MKRLLIILLTIFSLIALTACGDQGPGEVTDDTQEEQTEGDKAEDEKTKDENKEEKQDKSLPEKPDERQKHIPSMALK